MKKILLTLCVLMLCSGLAQAASMKVGGLDITYKEPKNYILAMSGIYEDMLDITRKTMPNHSKVHAIFVHMDSDAMFRENKENGLEKYLIISSNLQFDQQFLSLQDFSEFKSAIKEIHGDFANPDIKQEVDEALGKAVGDAVKVGELRSLGYFGETDTAISYMALVTQIVDTGSGQRVMELGSVTTRLLVEGKLLLINQYRPIKSEADIDVFRDEALALIKNMQFYECGVSEDESTLYQERDNSIASYLSKAFIAVSAVIVLALALVYFRKKRR